MVKVRRVDRPDKWVATEVILAEHLPRATRKGWLERDIFVGDTHYVWRVNTFDKKTGNLTRHALLSELLVHPN